MDSENNNMINNKMDIKIEIKEEPVCPNETLTQVKGECEEFETVFISSYKNSADYSEICNKIGIKLEPCCTEIKQESDLLPAAGSDLQNQIKETASHTEVITGDVAAKETSRLCTESMRRNSDSLSSLFTSTDSGEKSEHSYSKQPQMLESMDSGVKNCSFVQNCETSDMSESCGKKFKIVSKLCKVEQLYACKICNKSFLRLPHLKEHQKIHKKKRLHTCKICDKNFIRGSNLKQHLLIHEDKRPHICEICNRGFTRELHLKEHKLIHMGNSPHMCEICNKSYTQSANLKKHKLTHEGKRPYVCEICNKSFVLASILKNHKVVHEDRKPYNCDICKKCFRHLSTLKSHILIHKDKREFTCDICKKSYVRLSHLKQHKLTHDFKNLFKCDICDKMFSYGTSLKRHKLTHEA